MEVYYLSSSGFSISYKRNSCVDMWDSLLTVQNIVQKISVEVCQWILWTISAWGRERNDKCHPRPNSSSSNGKALLTLHRALLDHRVCCRILSQVLGQVSACQDAPCTLKRLEPSNKRRELKTLLYRYWPWGWGMYNTLLVVTGNFWGARTSSSLIFLMLQTGKC